MARDPNELMFELRLVDGYGRVHGAVTRPLDKDVAYRGQRIAEDLRVLGPLGGMSFDDAVEILQVKEFRRRKLIYCAQMAGGQLADFLEDREGWHGLDRQEATERRAQGNDE